jgi:hypothetical protein
MSLEGDGLVRTDLLAGTALGAVIGTAENGGVSEIEGARRALVHADAACGAKIGIDDRLAHGFQSFQ